MVITVDPPAAPETEPAPGAPVPEPVPAEKKAEDPPASVGGSVPETETETETETGPGWATVHPLRPAPASTTDSPVTSSNDGEEDSMTATNTTTMASGETLDPGSAHHFCEQMRSLGERMFSEIEQSVSSLSAAGVSGAPIALLSQMQEHAALFRDSAGSAQSHFARHLSTQDQVLSDDSLAATVSGTYIGTRT
ncbi:hypothetical protein [Pseudonocardia sp. ICBG601]|uniref:hypothetical protein n=1 Tax=Pseudonocardia sp. ICBG601 TaxID=2846759 RepID=UPI001CF65C01|nr:hypothetical protein [Pseudonocardia sp. ICBG601]